MSQREKYCEENCPIYSSNGGCFYNQITDGGKPEPVSPGQKCLHPDFDKVEYIRLWALGFVSGIKLRETD